MLEARRETRLVDYSLAIPHPAGKFVEIVAKLLCV